MDERRTAKDRIKAAWTDGDIIGLLGASLESFVNTIFETPLSYQAFLEYTGEYLDHFILDACEQEELTYVGGKLTLVLVPGVKESIALHADCYFQNAEKQWILKKKDGIVDKKRIVDYNSVPELRRLKTEKKLEYPIDAPDKEN